MTLWECVRTRAHNHRFQPDVCIRGPGVDATEAEVR
jgi:hypothetical protein